MENEVNIDELRKELKEARESYYNLTPTMSDIEYDTKKELLESISPEDKEVTIVGAEPPKYSVWEKVKHAITMGSLNKVNEISEFDEWSDKITEKTGETEFIITYKLDGSSLEIVYDKGKLVRCVTRGDGITGEDITENAVKIPNIPKEIAIEEKVVVRGEVMMTKSVFNEIYSNKYANPRNTAAGKIRDKKGGGEDCQNLTFIAFTLIANNAPENENTRFKILKKLGFTTPYYFLGDKENIKDTHNHIIEQRDNIEYEIDGTVVRVNSVKAQEELGELNMRPRGQIAWKFAPQTGITKVQNIKWQVGPTGRITPVASVDPVSIGGVTITSITLHNIAMFKSLKLFKGCEVLVCRRNDVIPYIQENLNLKKIQPSLENPQC